MLTGTVDLAALVAGVVPARLSGIAEVPPGWFAVPPMLTPFSAAFVHAGGLHLGFNLVMLIIAGSMVERSFGSAAVLIAYAVGALAAGLAQWGVSPASITPMVGASGAISALLAMQALMYPPGRARAIGPLSARTVQAIWLAAAWTALNVAIGLATAGSSMPIAAPAHIGGFLAGLLLFRPLLWWRWRDA